MPTIYTYRFATHWITTTEELTGYIERFVVPPEYLHLIEEGAMPDEALGVEDPYTEPPVEDIPPEEIQEPIE